MDKVQDATKKGMELLELLKRQKQYYIELRRLSKEQRALIDAQEPESLIRVLGQRQKIVDAIGKIHNQTAPYRNEWQTLRELLPTSLRESIQVLLADLQNMLDEILQNDREDSEKLSAAKQQMHTQIGNTHKVKSVVNNYNRTQINGGNFGGTFNFTG